MVDVRVPGRVCAPAAFTLAVIMVSGCPTHVPPHSDPDTLAGMWNLSLLSGGSMQLGLQLTPNASGSFEGRVVRMLSGDVEIDVSGFSRLEGQLLGDHLMLQSSSTNPYRLQLELVVDGEQLQVVSIRWRGDELVTPGQQWRATRGE